MQFITRDNHRIQEIITRGERKRSGDSQNVESDEHFKKKTHCFECEWGQGNAHGDMQEIKEQRQDKRVQDLEKYNSQ